MNQNSGLAHIYWIGGSPCAGKSTIARMLGEKYGFEVYSVDDYYTSHLQRANPREHPTWVSLRPKTWDEIWMRPVETLVAEEFDYYRQEWSLIQEDLASLPGGKTILAEGTSFIPETAGSILADPAQAVWIVPAEAFQRTHYPRRGQWVQGILSQCSQPEQAFQNWMDRDVCFARQIEDQVRQAGLNLLVVDGEKTIEENFRTVEALFKLPGR
jgi:hypothetical protein